MIRTYARPLLLALPLVAACAGSPGDSSVTSEGALQGRDLSQSFPALALIADAPVSYLQYTNFIQVAGRGGYGVGAHIEAAVQKVPFEKQVSVRFSPDEWQTSHDCALA